VTGRGYLPLIYASLIDPPCLFIKRGSEMNSCLTRIRYELFHESRPLQASKKSMEFETQDNFNYSHYSHTLMVLSQARGRHRDPLKTRTSDTGGFGISHNRCFALTKNAANPYDPTVYSFASFYSLKERKPTRHL
jgi:hypothetical protein